MGDLVLLFNEVELLDDAGVLLESILADDKQLLNDILDTSLDLTFMKNGSEALEDRIDSSRCGFREYLPTFDHEISSHLDCILSCVF